MASKQKTEFLGDMSPFKRGGGGVDPLTTIRIRYMLKNIEKKGRGQRLGDMSSIKSMFLGPRPPINNQGPLSARWHARTNLTPSLYCVHI